jgi:hypothetical protein
MIIDTTKESGGGILTNILHQEMTATRVFLNERGNVMNISSYKYQWSLLRLFLDWRTID